MKTNIEKIDKLFEIIKNEENGYISTRTVLEIMNQKTKMSTDEFNRVFEKFVQEVLLPAENMEYIKKKGLMKENIFAFLVLLSDFDIYNTNGNKTLENPITLSEKEKELLKVRIEQQDDLIQLFDIIKYIKIDQITKLIPNVEEFLFRCLINDKLPFKDEDIIRILKDNHLSEDFKFKCLKEPKIQLKKINRILYILLLSPSDHFFKKCIEDENIQLNKEDKEFILFSKELEYNLKNDFDKNMLDSIITLPSDMTKGIEIECEGVNSYLILQTIKYLKTGWIAKHDATLKDGVELNSPNPTSDNTITDNIRNSYEIKEMCSYLKKLGQTVSGRCGGHIHIGADYLTTKESWKNLLELWANNEEIIYTIANAKGEMPRIGAETYAMPYAWLLEKTLSKGSVNLSDEESLKKLVKASQGNKKNFGINFQNLGNKKNTIEFRVSNGTIDYKTWIENINLFGGLVEAAERLAQIELKPEDERTQDEKKLLENLKKLNSNGLNDKERLELFLEIVIPKEQRYIYQERYEVNSKLLKKFPIVKDTIFYRKPKGIINIKFNSDGISDDNNKQAKFSGMEEQR